MNEAADSALALSGSAQSGLTMLKAKIKNKLKELLTSSGLGLLLVLFRRVKFAYFRTKKPARIFQEIYERNAWNGAESVSGTGSDLRETEVVRRELARLLTELNISSMLDAPCGDFHWMKEIELGDVEYVGGDIVPELIRQTALRYSARRCKFRVLDIIRDDLPAVDLIFCRDALVHFPYQEVAQALANFRRSGATYLLTTTFPQHVNRDVEYMSLWRPLNLQASPFELPEPLFIVNEDCPEECYTDKSLALWRISDLPGSCVPISC